MKKIFLILFIAMTTTPSFSKIGSITKANILSNSLIRADYATVRLLIKEEPNLLITPNSSGLLPLSLAISRLNIQMIESLLNLGAPLEHANYNKQPIENAILLNSSHILKLLLQKGANPDTILSRRLYSVHLAALLNNKDILELLISYKADLDSQNSAGLSPLHIAVQQNNWGIVELLSNNKANPNIINKKGETPLIIAIQNRYLPNNFIKFFRGQENSIANYEMPIFYCIMQDNQNCVKDLIEFGADINSKNYLGNTPLMYSIRQKNTNMVEILLKSNPNLGIKNKNKKTAYKLALDSKDKELIKLLSPQEDDKD